MKKFELTEEQVQALEIVVNLLDDLDLTGEKIDLLDSIEEEINLRNKEADEDAEIYGFTDDEFFGMSADEFLSELFEM